MKKEDELKHLITSLVIELGGHYLSSEELFELTKSNFNNKAEVMTLFDKWIYPKWINSELKTKVETLNALEVSLKNPKYDYEEISDKAELPLDREYNIRQLFEWLYEYLKMSKEI